MRRHIKSRRQRKKFIFKFKIFTFLICLIILFCLADSYLKPIIKTSVLSKSQSMATQVINEAILEELNNQNIQYSDIVHIDRGADSKVQSLQTNTVKVNQLKSNVSVSVQNSLNSNNRSFGIPFGTFIGSSLLYGRGPDIPFKIYCLGKINATVDSNQSSAGINQTKHTIYINVTADITVFSSLHEFSSQVSTNVPVAETIIVGEVPKLYANLDSGSASDSITKDVVNELNKDIQ